jgi:mono/diheme cytochrome c family protein
MWPKSKPDRRAGLALAASVALAALSACRQDMHDQHKIEPYEATTFFPDSRGTRDPVAGTVARGLLEEDRHLYEGRFAAGAAGPAGELVDTFPMAVDRALLARGQERYQIFCSPCHARTGDGDGMVVRRGFQRPRTFHRDELRSAKVGYLYEVISKGLGVMPSYAPQISVPDRWAIVAYVRALQLSQAASIDDVPEPTRSELLAKRGTTPPGAPR